MKQKKNLKLLLYLVLGLFSFSFLSCSQQEEDDSSKNFKFDIGESRSIIIPSPATTKSCDDEAKGSSTNSITGSYFTLPNPVITWEGDSQSEVRVVVVKFKLNSPKTGSYECVFSDTTLKNLYYTVFIDNGVVSYSYWDGKLGVVNTQFGVKSTKDIPLKTATVTTGYNRCDIKCGGLQIPAGSGKFTATGTYEVIAVQRKYKDVTDLTVYEEFPIKKTGQFAVENVLN